MSAEKQFAVLNQQVIHCRKCTRLVRYREKVARTKRRMFRDRDYWGRPITGFGDLRAHLLVLGLAPAAHGGNRTGRVFTGDRSGDFLFRGLHQAGFGNQPNSDHRDDGLQLRNCYVTAAVRCCPPKNKPAPQEQKNCRPYLEQEFRLLRNLRAVLALGRIAHDTYLRLLRDCGRITRTGDFPFRHGAHYELPHPYFAGRSVGLFDSFHPSQQNTQTGRLSPAMFARVLRAVRRHLSESQVSRFGLDAGGCLEQNPRP